MSQKDVSAIQRAKYRLLRHLPGPRGQHYARKHRRAHWRETEALFAAAQEATRGMIAVDLGANTGEFTERLAASASRVYAFEPDPWALERLRQSVAGRDNVEIIAAAAGAEEGEVEIFRHEEFDSRPEEVSMVSTVMPDFSSADHEAIGERVPMVDFVAFLRGLDGRIGLVKMDIEGGEVPLLEALFASDQLERIDYIFCETHEPELPHMLDRYKALRARASASLRPVINLDWQ